jgi:hypothetical protein
MPPAASPAGAGGGSSWPALPSQFVSGRPATPADVGEGRAVFAAQPDAQVSVQPLHIQVPQYAYCAPDGIRMAGVIVQAETAQRMEVVGFRPLAGTKAYVTLLSSCELLGQSPAAGP